jgi:hypothetical protein
LILEVKTASAASFGSLLSGYVELVAGIGNATERIRAGLSGVADDGGNGVGARGTVSGSTATIVGAGGAWRGISSSCTRRWAAAAPPRRDP